MPTPLRHKKHAASRLAAGLVVLLALPAAFGCGTQGGHALWQFRTGYPVTAEPVAEGGAVYIGSDKMYCLDERTGQVRWSYKPIGKISSRAVVDGDRVFFTSGGLHCLDARTGTLLWEFWGDDWGQAAPVLHRGRVYAAFGPRIYCVDGDSGRRIWAVALKRVPAGRLIATGQGIIACLGGRIVSLDPGSGSPRWSFETGMRQVYAVTAGGRVFAGGWDRELLCLDDGAGTLLWRRTIGVPMIHAPLVQGDRVLIVAGDVRCFDADSGDREWISEGIVLSPLGVVARDGMVFAWGMGRSRLIAFDLARREFLGTVELPPGRFAVTSDYVLVSSSDYRVYCCRRPQPVQPW